jgi:hypothetical protein
MKTVRVDIKEAGERELKVTWNENSPWQPYTIHRPAVDSISAEIRRTLRELVIAGMKERGAVERSGPILKNLAEQGAELYQALITPTVSPPDHPRDIIAYCEEEPYRLRFCVSDGVFAPWGLIYAADPASLPDHPPALAAEVYSAFWCLSRQLATVYDRLPPNAIGRGQDASALGMIRVVHPHVFQAATDELPLEGPERGFLEWLKNRYGDPITTARELKKVWPRAGAETGLLYFYCHASASMLALGEEETIEASRLLLTLADAERPAGRCGCLVLMNGCSTAVGDRSGSFLVSTSQRGMCGFIATETEVPNVFALRFSLCLLDLLFREGLTLGEAMQRLYVAHFPMSLLYGVYANPGFRMPQAEAPNVRNIDEKVNLSLDQLGTRELGEIHGGDSLATFAI